MRLNQIQYIESQGFRIVGRYIYKRSETNNRSKVVGQLNDNNFFFHSENVAPFKAGVNFYDDSSITDNTFIQKHIAKVKENERNDFNVSFEEYISSTSVNSIFTSYIAQKTKDFLNSKFKNHYDIRGVLKGYMESSVCFPFFNYDNEFVTAQIIKYGTDGKRIKSDFSTNWYHAYKPIKKALNLNDKDKYSVPINCFFGENYLKGSNNIVGIVEAPKTAVILKEIYTNIDWIATAGEQALFNKNLEVLKDKRVVLFPDAHSSKWVEFGKKEGLNVCEILNIRSVEKGSDIADFIFEDSAEVFSDLHEYLFSLNAGYFDSDIIESLLELNFKVIKEESVYFTALPYRYEGKNLMHQIDDSSDFKIDFNGKHFQLFTDKYAIRNAQIDWHKKDRKEGDILKGFNKDGFVWHLQKSFRILKELNPDTDYKAIFGIALNKLNNESNFSFNEVYVKRILVPLWESYEVNLDNFNKYRDWKYKGSKQLTRTDFNKELNNDRFKRKLNMTLLAFQDVLKENRYIDIETDLALNKFAKYRGFTQLFDLVKQWNKDVIGCSTVKTYFKKVEFFNKLDKCTEKLPPHISDIYRAETILYSSYSFSEISEITGVTNRATVKDFLTFKKNRDTETLVMQEVEYLLGVIKDINPIRSIIRGKEGKKDTVRIYDFRYIEPANEWASLYKNRGNWFAVKEEDSVPIFLPKEKLLLEKEKTTEKVYSDILSWSIKYLDYLDSLKQERSKSKVIRLSDIQVRSSSKEWYSPDEKLSLKLVNF
jgi:hypothetical protein